MGPKLYNGQHCHPLSRLIKHLRNWTWGRRSTRSRCRVAKSRRRCRYIFAIFFRRVLIFGSFGQFWVIFGLFWVILGNFWAIFFCCANFFVAKYTSVLSISLFATLELRISTLISFHSPYFLVRPEWNSVETCFTLAIEWIEIWEFLCSEWNIRFILCRRQYQKQGRWFCALLSLYYKQNRLQICKSEGK